jgi:hypothetical protein
MTKREQIKDWVENHYGVICAAGIVTASVGVIAALMMKDKDPTEVHVHVKESSDGQELLRQAMRDHLASGRKIYRTDLNLRDYIKDDQPLQ